MIPPVPSDGKSLMTAIAQVVAHCSTKAGKQSACKASETGEASPADSSGIELTHGGRPSVGTGRLVHRQHRRLAGPVDGCPAHLVADAPLKGLDGRSRMRHIGEAAEAHSSVCLPASGSGSSSSQPSRSSRVSTSPVRGPPWRYSQAIIAGKVSVGAAMPPGIGITSTAMPGARSGSSFIAPRAHSVRLGAARTGAGEIDGSVTGVPYGFESSSDRVSIRCSAACTSSPLSRSPASPTSFALNSN
jgi:hypothetical protein